MKTMQYKFIKGVIPLLLTGFVLTGCIAANKQENVSNTAAVEKEIHTSETVKDNKLIYKSDDPYSVVTMYLTVRKGNEGDGTNHSWNEVNSYSTYYYDENNLQRFKVEGLIQVGDENGPKPGELGFNATTPNATVQIRGKTTSLAQQKSYKIEVKKDKGRWREQRTIALNKHIYDSVRFRNKLSYDLMKEFPSLIGARTQFVHLYVKDLTENNSSAKFEDYGLYTQVEQMNTRYLKNHGFDENGQFYKASMFEFFTYSDSIMLSTDENYNRKAFEQVLEIKGNEDHSKLISMLQDVNSYEIPIEEVLEKHFDEDNYLSWLAFQMLLGNTDVVSQNFNLYSPQNSQKWYFVAWDNDDAWNSYELAGEEDSEYNYEKGISQYWGVVLHQRMLKSPQLRAKFHEKVEMFKNYLTKELIAEKVEAYRQVAEPYRFRAPDSEYSSFTLEQYRDIINHMPDEIEHNYQMYLRSLEHPSPFIVSAPYIIGDKILFSANASYDFAGEPITYTFDLATDYLFQNVISHEENMTIPQFEHGTLSPGQYFYRFIAHNVSGKTQTAMTYYEGEDDIKHHGVSMFYVQADGSILQE